MSHIVTETEEKCPECTGTNLNEDRTLCWDCSAGDYSDEGN
jgi:RNA polymerase subunit RPABC4/transcription elongation factor Spt4